MDGEWRKSTVGAEATLQRGFDITRKEQRSGSVPVISSSGVSSYHNIPAVKGPGVIIGRKGSLGTVFYVEEDYWPHDTTLWVKDFHDNDPKFVYYFFKSLGVMHLDVGTANPTLNRNHVHPIPVLWPPLTEQCAIAHILGTLDDKIELNRQMNKTLEAIAQALFKSWFVNFDPVHARMEGRQPYGMDAETAALFPDSFEDSVLGEIPRGWKVGRVSDLIFLNRDGLDPAKCPDEIFEHYSIPAFDEGRLPKKEAGKEIKSNKFIVPPHAVLLSKLNPDILRVWFPKVSTVNRSICSTEFLVTQSRVGFTCEYLYAFFTSAFFLETFASLVTGTTGSHQRVKPEDLLAMEIIIPRSDLIVRFTEFTEPLYELISQNIEESSVLASIRDTLLPRLLSGR